MKFGRSMMSVEHRFERAEPGPGPRHDACSYAEYLRGCRGNECSFF